jgi:hypothetical protein
LNSSAVGPIVGPTVETGDLADRPNAGVAEGTSNRSSIAAAAAADAGIDDDVQAVLDRAIAARKYAEHIAEGGSLDGSSTTATTTAAASENQWQQKQPLNVTRQSAAAQKGSLADPRQYFGGLDTSATAVNKLGELCNSVLLLMC